MRSLLILTGLFLANLTHAGQETHGGDILYCQGKPAVVLDYYVAQLPSPTNPNRKIVNISGMQATDVIEFFRNRLKDTYFGDAFDRASLEIGDLSQWVAAEGLSDVKDDGLGFRIPDGCGLYQGALRIGNIVYIDPKVTEGLSQSQLGLLVVHEILYKLAKEKGLETSATTRHVVRALLEESLNQQVLTNAVHALGWPLAYIEIISDRQDENLYHTIPEFDRVDAVIKIIKNDKAAKRVYFQLWYGVKGGSLVTEGSAYCGNSSTCSVTVKSPEHDSDWIMTGDALRFVGDGSVDHIRTRQGNNQTLITRYQKR